MTYSLLVFNCFFGFFRGLVVYFAELCGWFACASLIVLWFWICGFDCAGLSLIYLDVYWLLCGLFMFGVWFMFLICLFLDFMVGCWLSLVTCDDFGCNLVLCLVYVVCMCDLMLICMLRWICRACVYRIVVCCCLVFGGFLTDCVLF